MNKLFCDKLCETAAHQKKTAPEECATAALENTENTQKPSNEEMEKIKAAKEAAAKKKKADKKAKKKPNAGTTRCSGEFWWA